MNYLQMIYAAKVEECFGDSDKNPGYTIYLCLRTVGEYKNRVFIRKNDNSEHIYSNVSLDKHVWDSYFNLQNWAKDPCMYPPFDGDWTVLARVKTKDEAMDIGDSVRQSIGFTKQVRVDSDFGNGVFNYRLSKKSK